MLTSHAGLPTIFAKVRAPRGRNAQGFQPLRKLNRLSLLEMGSSSRASSEARPRHDAALPAVRSAGGKRSEHTEASASSSDAVIKHAAKP